MKYDSYLKFRKSIDKEIQKLEKEHQKHMNCKAGCCNCCMDFSVLPVEYYYILENTLDFPKNTPEGSSCSFLINKLCGIYDNRPMICRTHGAPILFYNEEEDDWQLTFCELNFSDFDAEDFSEENIYDQDYFNNHLYQINSEFVEKYYPDLSPDTLIPLKQLYNDLKNR